MSSETPKLLSIPKAAKAIGMDIEEVRAAVKRAVDPLPSVSVGKGGKGEREYRKVLMTQVDAWLARQAGITESEERQCG